MTQTKKSKEELKEDQYWRDFHSGVSLKKYKPKLIKKLVVDKNVGSMYLIGR